MDLNNEKLNFTAIHLYLKSIFLLIYILHNIKQKVFIIINYLQIGFTILYYNNSQLRLLL